MKHPAAPLLRTLFCAATVICFAGVVTMPAGVAGAEVETVNFKLSELPKPKMPSPAPDPPGPKSGAVDQSWWAVRKAREAVLDRWKVITTQEDAYALHRKDLKAKFGGAHEKTTAWQKEAAQGYLRLKTLHGQITKLLAEYDSELAGYEKQVAAYKATHNIPTHGLIIHPPPPPEIKTKQ